MTKALAVIALIAAGALPSVSNAQDVHQLPFASAGNTIELAISNDSAIPISAVKVEATNIPSWLQFSAAEQRIAAIKSNEEMPALFSFSMDKTAPVNKDHTLRFIISAPTGERWTKEITIAVAAPERFELLQNYPNPFNPTTTIAYQLTSASRASLKVFDLLGREVVTLVDGDRTAGYQYEAWDASRFSSGMYVYQLTATDEHGSRQIARKAMLLLR